MTKLTSIKFIPNNYSYVVEKILKTKAKSLFPQLDWTARTLNEKTLPTFLVRIVQTTKGQYDEESDYNVGEYCIAELDSAMTIELGQKEYFVVGVDDIIGKIVETD